MTCSLLWVRCLFDRFSISDFRGKWPRKWKFSKISFRTHRRDTEIRFLAKCGENRPLRSCLKVVWITTQKTRALWDSSQPPFWAKWADRAQNSASPGAGAPISKFWDPLNISQTGTATIFKFGTHVRAGAYCGGHLAAQLVTFTILILLINLYKYL